MTVNSYLTEQEKSILEHAVIGIAGAGGRGLNRAMHLVRSGVRKFVIADVDTVSAGT
ncbi:MAG: ThiF family adenylyltransferase [Victivallales bacterium]